MAPKTTTPLFNTQLSQEQLMLAIQAYLKNVDVKSVSVQIDGSVNVCCTQKVRTRNSKKSQQVNSSQQDDDSSNVVDESEVSE